MQDLPPGWVAVLVALVAALQGCLTAYLGRRNSYEHRAIRRELQDDRDERRNGNESK